MNCAQHRAIWAYCGHAPAPQSPRPGEPARGAPGYLDTQGTPDLPRDLAGHRLIATPTDTASGIWRFGTDEAQAIEVAQRLAMTSVAAAIHVAKQGWGLTRALSYQVAEDIEAGILRTVLDAYEPAPLPVHLVHVEGRRAPAKVRSFLDFAAARLRQVGQLG